MPHSVFIQIELIDPVVFSASGASAGLHRTHQIVPGAQLLGVAARGFDWKCASEGFKLFRSGAVKFGNGYPVNETGKICYPVPRSLHASKKGSATGNSIKTNFDMSSENWPETAGQPKQYRAGFMAADLCTYGKDEQGNDDANKGVETKYVLKSAHDKKHGSAKEAQLFGYEMIVAGNKFIAEISGEQSDVEKVLGYLIGEKYMGRSKWTEFGAVKITKVEIQPELNPQLEDLSSGLSLWAISDLYFFDKLGQPSLAPCAEQFGVKNAVIDWEKSYIWKREFTPFNGALRAAEVSRYGIGAGSVIRFKAKDGESIAINENVLNAGVGSFLESGAGQVRFMPHKDATAVRVDGFTEANPENTDDNPLLHALKGRQASFNAKAKSQVFYKNSMVNDFKKLYKQTGKKNRPSNSQWGRVIDAIRDNEADVLGAKLFDDDNAICTENKWGKFSGEFKSIYDEIIKEEFDLQLIVKRLAEDLRQIGGDNE